MKLSLASAALLIGASVSNVESLALGRFFKSKSSTAGMPPLPEKGKAKAFGKIVLAL